MNKKKSLIMILLLIGLSFIFIGIGVELSNPINNKNIKNQTIQYMTSNNENVTYLSDIEYISSQSFAGWDKIRYDETNSGKITLKIENSVFTFNKGIWAHASSQITYDISKYNYKYFTAFVGLNATSSAGNGVKFNIYTSKDGATWSEPSMYTKMPKENATFIKIDLKEAKYLRLSVDSNGSNAQDHSVYADAKLTNNSGLSSSFKTVEEYNEIIKSQYTGQADLTGDIEFNLLKKELIKNVGQFTINSFYNESDDNKAALDYLMSNQKALKYYILGGKPASNNYYKSLTEYSRLYRNYKNDFNNLEVTKYGTVIGDLYLRMATSLSLTHAGLVGLWMNNASTPENQSDSVRRYAIIKYMHKNNLFQIPGMDYNMWFENYTVEEMRYVMANNIDDQSMLWLNAYVRELIEKEGTARIWPHRYISYVWPNYANPVYYAEENKDYFNELFSVPDEEHEGQRIGLWDVVYTIPGGVDVPEYKLQIPRGTSNNKIYKVWMNMRNKFGTGAVCGGISKTGSNIRGVLGLPDAVVGQPGHAAHINYFQNSKGEGYWGIDNDVSGWAYTGSSGLLGWASGPYASGYTGTYIPLAQEVINHEDTYEQSQKFVYLADTYSDLAKKEEMYRKALEVQPLNLNAWYGLILTYNASSNKTEEQYYELAKEIAENLKYYPLPMYQMTNQIKPKLTSQQGAYKFTLLQTRILKEGSATPNNSTAVLQPSITRLMANYILGQMDTTIATFSFDGEDAGKIVLSSRFDGNGVRWDYSIDGKKTWKEVSFSADEEHKLQLTKAEIASMTSDNDLYIHIVGVNYSDENLYKIDINESKGLPSTLFANDLENKLMGAVDPIEWKYNEQDNWIRYGNKKPELTGNKSVIVRMGATGTYLASANNSTFVFTEDVVNSRRKYISVEHISLEAFSTEAANQQGSASFAFDANYNTRWHSAWNGSDTQRFITAKLDKPVYLSAVEFVPAGGGNGKIYDGTIWGSMDGENWIILSQKKGITYSNSADNLTQAVANIKSFDIVDPQKVQYVKIVADRTNGNWITARAFNFYEDTTVKAVASFSFDGLTPGTISIYDEYKNESWKYSIDGGKTWATVKKGNKTLSASEIEKITDKNKIKIVVEGDKTEYIINIKKGEPPEKGYLNDLENRPIAQPEKDSLEWKISGDDKWTSYKEKEPNVRGTNTLLVRRKATGLTSASSSIKYQFTEDNQPKTRKYIPINHLAIHAFSTQSVDSTRPFYAPNAIDGNINTLWHTDFRYDVRQQEIKPFLTIKLDKVKSVSALEFIQKRYRDADPILVKNATVYVSVDGEKWTEAAKVMNLSQEEQELRKINFKESVEAQYVKLEMETYDIFASISMINLYEDITSVPVMTPTAEIEYSTTKPTNKDVVVKLVKPSTDIIITNNGGKDTYTFTKNGSFTFKFEDNNGEVGTATAKVTWIDKKIPNATVTYNTTKSTNKDVVATITFDKENVTVEGGNTHVFKENGKYEFKFTGPAGNKGVAVAEVTWIDKIVPLATIEYSSKTPTNKDVVATIKFNEKDVKITNNNSKNTYTFKNNGEFVFNFEDAAGNKGTAKAIVNWIDRTLAMPTITYSTKSPTNKSVIATVTFDKDGVIVEGGNTHTFTENGKYEFKFTGPAGNKGMVLAEVTWIDKRVPEAIISYNPTNPTNKDVIATIDFDEKNVKIINNGGKNTYKFTENGRFMFEYIDQAGNKGKETAIVNIIDKVIPTAEVKYSTTKPTNKNVVVTLTDYSEDITITNNDGKNTYTFTKNGTFTFEFKDKAGNVGSVKAIVNNINKVAPTAKVKYSTTQLTNKNVLATLTGLSKDIIITNNGGKNTYTFTKNGTFTFEFKDKAGNVGSTVAIVNNIDKIAPIGKLTYSTTNPTNKNVIATLSTNEDVTVANNNGKNTYTFTENGTFTFEFKDRAGNKGTATATVSNIDKVAPTAKVSYSTTKPTNKDVVVTLKDVSEDIIVTNNNGKNTYTFVENGSFTFEFVDKAGNKGTATAIVHNIDKVAPTAKVSYSTTKPTNKDVVVTLKDASEDITITNNGGKNTYTFTKNGVFVFEFIDKAGNKGQAKAIVNNINKVAPTARISYSTTALTNRNVVATLTGLSNDIVIINNGGKNTYTFTENGTFTFEFRDKVGNVGSLVAIVNNIDRIAPTATVEYSTTKLTNKDVIVKLTNYSEDIIITNNSGKNTYTFTENGTFTFEFKDKAGNKGTATATVSNIDKVVPTAKVSYSTMVNTTKPVIVTLKDISDDAIIINNNGKNTYTFTKNGIFEFIIQDKAGNQNRIKAIVNWIVKVTPVQDSNTNNNYHNNVSTKGNKVDSYVDRSSTEVSAEEETTFEEFVEDSDENELVDDSKDSSKSKSKKAMKDKKDKTEDIVKENYFYICYFILSLIICGWLTFGFVRNRI